MGLQECRASGAAALAGRRHPRRHASASARARRGTRDDPGAIRRGGWRLCPLAQGAVRASPMAGKARASSSIASQRPRACRWPRAPRPPMGTSGPRSSHGWTRSTSAQVNGAGRAHASRCGPRIRAMMPKTCASAFAHGVAARSSPHASGTTESRGGAPCTRTSRASKPSGRWRGSRASTADRSSAGNASRHASTPFSRER